jgi:2-polyprenyl-3-methyl-5-hydroxy-6-metoxy-1,4-benzoquinol methylase
MYDFHKDKNVYFHYQYLTSKEYIIPYLENRIDFKQKLNVLEIGCAEAGVLKAFCDLGHTCTGIELNHKRVLLAQKFMEKELKSGQIRFISKNIHDIDPEADIDGGFDLIILKDVIEHIHNQELFISQVSKLLKKGGKLFFAFPPWQMPFGGHQQICSNKYLSKLPYYHLLPRFMYEGILNLFKEPDYTVKELLEIKETGISVERFENILKKNNFKTIKKTFFLFNPIYKYKFGLKPRLQFNFIKKIPYLRNFLTTAVYYLVE